MGAAAPARPGLVEACNEEVRRTAEPRSAATAGPAVRDYSGQPVPAALGREAAKAPTLIEAPVASTLPAQGRDDRVDLTSVGNRQREEMKNAE
jgi:hypothetical protein